MNEATHTRGPWQVGETHVETCRGIPIAPIMDADDFPCFDPDGDSVEEWAAELKANAKLIAAAPEMLEALQYVLSNISRIPDEVMDTITNAIRKATQ